MPLAHDPTKLVQAMPSSFLEATVLDPPTDAKGMLRIEIEARKGQAVSVPWIPRLDVPPSAGDAVLVGESDEGNYWCVQWWPQKGLTPLVFPTLDGSGHIPIADIPTLDVAHIPPLAGPTNVPIPGVGISGSKRAGRKLTVADFTQLLGISAPIALYNFDGNAHDSSGNGRDLTVTTAAPSYTAGITGAASEAVRFVGNNAMALFLADASGGPFNIRTGTFGCWFRTPKTATSQRIMAKGGNSAGNRSWILSTDGVAESLKLYLSVDGTNQLILLGATPVHDNRWHFGVGTYDGAIGRLYVDGDLDGAAKLGQGGDLFQEAQPFNIGSAMVSAVAGTGSEGLPMFGPVDEAFVHPEVLDLEQIRLLMAASIAHGLGAEPALVSVKVKRRRRGGRLVQANFPTPPRRIYNLGSDVVGDEGTDAAGAGTVGGTLPYVDGMDGQPQGAKSFPGATGNFLSFPTPSFLAGTNPKSVGCWFLTDGTGSQMTVLANTGGTDWRPLYIQASGVPATWDGTGLQAGQAVGEYACDGVPHFWVATWDNADVAGQKRKIYLDGRMVGSDTSMPAITAGTFTVGQTGTPAEPYKGLLDGLFLCDYALTPEAVAALFAVGSKALPSALFDQSIVEAADATNLYLLAHHLDPQHLIDLRVAA